MPKRERGDDKEARRAAKRERLDAKRAQKAEAKRDRINAALRISTAAPEEPTPAPPDERTTAAKKKPKLLKPMLVREKGVRILDLRVGRGDAVTTTSHVRIEYVGRLDNERGAVFDEGVITCALARTSKRSVIEGWTIGLSGARVGGKRRLIIPPVAGYGMEAQGKAIPAGSTLCFDVKVLPGCGLKAGDAAAAAAEGGDDDSEACPDLVPFPEPGPKARFAPPYG